MRIGIDVGRMLHGRGGVAIYTRELVRTLASSAEVSEIHCFDLDHGVCDRSSLERSLGPLPQHMHLQKPDRRSLAEIDLFHAPGFRMPRHDAGRYLFTLHDLTVVSLPECHTLANRVRTVDAIVDALCRGATMLAVSEATRDEATRLLALTREKIEVLPPMLDPVFGTTADESEDLATRDRLGIDGAYALAVGSLEPRKNLGRLLDAWRSLPDSAKAGHRLVVLAISGWRQDHLKSSLEELSRQRSILLLEDPLSGQELAALYRGASVLVFPSLAEGFGLPVAEAMACGTPVITSDRSSMPEVAGRAALLVDPEDVTQIASAIRRILADRDLAERLSLAGVERSGRFSGRSALPHLIEIYRRVIEA